MYDHHSRVLNGQNIKLMLYRMVPKTELIIEMSLLKDILMYCCHNVVLYRYLLKAQDYFDFSI